MRSDRRTQSWSASIGLMMASCLIDSVSVGQEPAKTIRVLTYNIHHGEGVDGKVDLARQAEVIKSVQPDLVALQEVDDRTLRTGNVDQTAELARLTGLQGRFVHQLDFEGGRYGQAILSRFAVSDVTLHWLPGTPDRERRMAGIVSVEIYSTPIRFITTHLHHNNDVFRKDQALRLNNLFAADDAANGLTFLAGDLNAVPQSVPMQILGERWQSVTDEKPLLTFPADKPERQLDYILFRPLNRITVSSVKVVDEAVASDHRPLVAEFVLP